MRTVAQRVAYAVSMVGSTSLSGWCEKFTRQCFGFPARYGSALDAWRATKHRHKNINNAPAGVPIFWNLHPANPNYRFGHVAISVGGGYCITTSAGPNRSIAKVRIADLTRAWQMTPLGWTEDYHGQRVYEPKAPAPKPAKGRHVVSNATIRDRLRAAGYRYPADGLLSTWIDTYHRSQAYAPGLVFDKIWGPATEAHWNWTRALQRRLNTYQAVSPKLQVDGDHRAHTKTGVRQFQARNHPSAFRRGQEHRAIYRGAIDGIPGPVTCASLSIDPHPGL